jgi:hypothetical protein
MTKVQSKESSRRLRSEFKKIIARSPEEETLDEIIVPIFISMVLTLKTKKLLETIE